MRHEEGYRYYEKWTGIGIGLALVGGVLLGLLVFSPLWLRF